ncbi:MAG: efflux RND transporter permease subunit [Moorellales bacterium]
MNFLRGVVNRPVAVLMVVVALLLLGAVSFTGLKLDLLPQLQIPVALVATSYPGAGPEEVEKLVTRPLEEALGTVNGVKSLYSYSSSGLSLIILELTWGTNLDFAALDVREKIDLIEGLLPEGVEDPQVLKMDPTLMPVMQLALGGSADLRQLRAVAEEQVKSRLERVEGVASADVLGGRTREIAVLVDPAALAARGLSLTQVVQSLQATNLSLSGGYLPAGEKEYLLKVTGEFTTWEEIRDLPLITGTGAVVRLGDVAAVEDGFADLAQVSRINGQPCVSLVINKRSDANPVEVARGVRAALKELEGELPPGMQFYTVFDQARYIETVINNVLKQLVEGAVLAALILFFFLRRLRSTLVLALAMPVSIIATFVMMRFAGLNLNLMTLGGLALGVGMMVDGGIVVLENIFRHQEEGRAPLEAAVLGSGEVANAVTASILTNVVVFLPIVFTEGLAQELFTPLALTVSFSLLASLLVALTVVPTLAARLSGAPAADTGWIGSLGRALTRLQERYVKVLAGCLAHRRRVMLGALVAVVASLALTPVVGVELLPAMDQSLVSVTVELPRGSTLEETDRVARRIEEAAQSLPEVRTVATTLGSAFGQMGGTLGGRAVETATMELELVPKNQRRRSSEEVAEALRRQLADLAGARIAVSGNALMGSGSSQYLQPVEIQIRGDDLDTLRQVAEQVAARVRSVPGTREVKSSLEQGRPEAVVRVRPAEAARYGLTPAQVASAVRTAVQGQVATYYRVGGQEIAVRVRLPEGARSDLASLEGLLLLTPTGARVPLSSVGEIEIGQGPSTIQRRDQARLATVTASLAAGYNLGRVTQAVQAALADLKLPVGYSLEYGGQVEEMSEAFGSLGVAFVIAIALVYMVMAAQFESLVHPFTIMLSLPLAAVGAVLGLLLTGRNFNITAFMGLVVLAGIVVNNAIVLIDYTNLLRRRGLGREEALLLAGSRRLRPILMTALTTVLGMLPLTLGLGEGAEYEAPMATVIVGGLLTSTLLTLVVVPVVYTWVEDLGARLRRRRAA